MNEKLKLAAEITTAVVLTGIAITATINLVKADAEPKDRPFVKEEVKKS